MEYYLDWQLLSLKEGNQVVGWLILANDRADYYRWQEIGHQAENFSTITAIIGPLAHELRNPLAAAKGLLQLSYRRKEPEKSAAYIELVLQEIDRMSVLVNEFLKLGRSANTQFEPVNFAELIQELSPLFDGEIFGTGIELILDLEPVPSIMADSNQLTQILLNLTRNAVEAFNDRQGYIKIILRSSEESVVLKIQDNGPGFNSEVLKNLFQPFVTTKEGEPDWA